MPRGGDRVDARRGHDGAPGVDLVDRARVRPARRVGGDRRVVADPGAQRGRAAGQGGEGAGAGGGRAVVVERERLRELLNTTAAKCQVSSVTAVSSCRRRARCRCGPRTPGCPWP